MKTLIVDSKKLFYYTLISPDSTYDEADEKGRFISEKRKEANGELMLFQWNDKVGVVGNSTDGSLGVPTLPNSIQEYDIQDIQGLILVNTRPARGAGFVRLDVRLKNKREPLLFMFFMKDNSSDVARWDKKVKIFEDEVLPGILSFMNMPLLRKDEGFNC